jgi:hypothetical protein
MERETYLSLTTTVFILSFASASRQMPGNEASFYHNRKFSFSSGTATTRSGTGRHDSGAFAGVGEKPGRGEMNDVLCDAFPHGVFRELAGSIANETRFEPI